MEEKNWDKIITSNNNTTIKSTIKEIWTYKEMIIVLVKKNFTAIYKQTILGPAWAFIQPLISSLVFTFIFGNIANLQTDGIPQFLYYFCSLIFWNYFSNSLIQVSNTFIDNGYLMGKVYFPRFIMPLTNITFNLITFFIQFILLIIFYISYLIIGTNIHIEPTILLLPIYFLELILLSLGLGSILASITTKYKDITRVITFFIQLWMYATPIAYSSTIIPPNLYLIYHLNPLTNILEWITYSFYGIGNPSIILLIYSLIISLIIFIIGLKFFQKSEKTFLDTI